MRDVRLEKFGVALQFVARAKGEIMSAERKSITVSRRALLAGAAGAGTFLVVPRHVLGGGRQTAPSDRINVACVGAGGQAVWNINQLEEAGARIAC